MMTYKEFMALHIECEDENNVLYMIKEMLIKAQNQFKNGDEASFNESKQFEYTSEDVSLEAYFKDKEDGYLSIYIGDVLGGTIIPWDDDDDLIDQIKETIDDVYFS